MWGKGGDGLGEEGDALDGVQGAGYLAGEQRFQVAFLYAADLGLYLLVDVVRELVLLLYADDNPVIHLIHQRLIIANLLGNRRKQLLIDMFDDRRNMHFLFLNNSTGQLVKFLHQCKFRLRLLF